MRSAPFGRRVVEARGTAVVPVIEPAEEPCALADLVVNDQYKARIHANVMSRIDPSSATRVPRERLQAEVARLVSEIATGERIQLNEVEESQLAVELTHDMIGLGPLEPLLADAEVTDILVNGPFDIYVERFGRLERT